MDRSGQCLSEAVTQQWAGRSPGRLLSLLAGLALTGGETSCQCTRTPGAPAGFPGSLFMPSPFARVFVQLERTRLLENQIKNRSYCERHLGKQTLAFEPSAGHMVSC